MPLRSARYWVGVASLAAVYFATARLGLQFDPVSGFATYIWPPIGISVAALALFGFRIWPGIAAGAFLVNLSIGANWLAACGIAAGNTLAPLLGAYLLQRGAGFQPALERLRDVLRLSVLAGALCTVISATTGASCLWLDGLVNSYTFGTTWLAWWVGDSLGVLVFAPLFLTWFMRPPHRVSAAGLVEAAVLTWALLIVGLSVLATPHIAGLQDTRLEYLIFPLVIWAALRFGPRGAATATFGILVLAVFGAVQHLGPFARESLRDSLLLSQLFVAAAVVTGLFLAAVVAERTHAEQQARENEARLITLAQAAPGILFTNRPDGWTDYTSQQFYDYTGMPPGSAAGYGWAAVIHPDDVERTQAQRLACIQAGQPFELQHRFRAKDGSYRWFLARGVPLRDEQGQIVKWIGACIDIDQQKRAEEALRDADRRKDEFLAMLAHELRNPLTPIVNALHVIKQRGEERREAVVWAHDMMQRQVAHLIRLVDDLLDVSRITRGIVVLRKEPIELATIVRQSIEEVRPLQQARRHELTVALPVEPLWLDADPTRLVQVLANLLNNAAKYTEPGGHISVAAERLDAEVVLRVKDNGVGIAPELVPQVFDLFVQAERALARSHGGLGIGLTLVRRLVEMHGGQVTARSAGLNQGSEFVIRLPMLRDAQPGQRPPAAVVAPQDGASLRVLVVDDNADAADSLALLLRTNGHKVEVAYDGAAALEAARVQQPEIVFLDIGLPILDGYEVAKRLHQRADVPRPLIVALTGYGREGDRRQAAAAGFDRYLVKPVDPTELTRLLATLANGAERRADYPVRSTDP